MSNAVTKIDDNAVGTFLKDYQEKLFSYMPDYLTPKQGQFIRSAMMLISESDQLKECLSTPAGKISLYHAMKYAASVGLSLSPLEGKAALIAYGGKATYQVMKNGMIEMAQRSGKIKFITSDTVRKNDKFSITKGMDGDVYEFKPALEDRGDIIGFFAAVKLKTGETMVSYMTAKEIEEHRDKYSAMFRAKPDASPWKKSFEGMGLKTVLKRLFRNVHLSDDMDRAIGTDDMAETWEPEEKEVGSGKGTAPEQLTEKINDAQTEPAPSPEPEDKESMFK